MEWFKDNWRLIAASIAIALLVLWYTSTPSPAADLGGGCCADLEERIAELEATTARKGNRKVSVEISGQINKALMHVSGDGIDSDTMVIENSAEPSRVVINGAARITPEVTAGYVLAIGVGEHRDVLTPDFANGIFVEQSYAYVDSKALGKVSVGLASQASRDIAQRSTANTKVAARLLSLRPINGPQIGEAADIFEGGRTNLVRYDSPTLMGAVLSASWATGHAVGPADGDDVWDVALRWAGEGQGFRILAGAAYRHGIVIPDVGNIANTPAGDLTTWMASASAMHIESGVFVSGAYGHLDFGPANLTAYHVQGGLEKKLSSYGKTTIFAEWAQSNDTLDIGLWGAGIVQNFDGAGLDLYLSGRQIDLGGDNATAVMAGARVSF